MDLFSFLILLLMATFTLSSAGLLVGLVVMERSPESARAGSRRTRPRRRYRNGKRIGR